LLHGPGDGLGLEGENTAYRELSGSTFCWVAATLPSSLAGCGWPILGRAQRPKEVKNCGQPQPQAEATPDVSACKPTEACRRAKPALWRKEECTGKDRVVLARSDPDSNQTMTGARQHAEQRLKGGTVSLRLVSRQLTTAALSLLVALLVAAPAAHAAPPQVVHEQTIRFETETLETVCGDTAVFDRSGKITFTFVGMSEDVFLWTAVNRAPTP
jgi:hypothetical protein